MLRMNASPFSIEIHESLRFTPPLRMEHEGARPLYTFPEPHSRKFSSQNVRNRPNS